MAIGLKFYAGDGVLQDSKEAVKYLSKAEQAGNALAAYYLGLCHYYGQGVNASDGRAHALFEKAARGGVEEAKNALKTKPFPEHNLMTRAKAGDGDACCRLAHSYNIRSSEYPYWEEGYRLEKEWLEVAAEYGDPHALIGLGNVYRYGWHVRSGDVKDQDKSKECYERAYKIAQKAVESDENNAYAKFWLGWCFIYGLGCEKDGERGYELKRQAESAGYSYTLSPVETVSANESAAEQMKRGEEFRSAADKAEWKAECGEDVEKNTAEARVNHIKALECFTGAVEGECVFARYHLAEYFYKGIIVEKDYAKALEILRPLAKVTHGNSRVKWYGPAAARMIGDIYSSGGYGVERDDKKAFNWYLSAAKRDIPRACTKVGNAYFYGIGTDIDYVLAASWFEDAVFDYDEQMYNGSDKGYDYEANVGLGDCYRLGLGVKKDEEEAFRLYYDVAKYTSDCPSADERTARCYYFGIGVEKDENLARGYWKNAAERGDEDAKAALKKYFPEE